METIHFKTVDPVSQELLQAACRKGIDLNWERYEKQQPQDGFLRLGLCCPYGCLQGPCRIDPYGRGAQQGICGLDRDQMAAASLLRLTLQGVMETLAASPETGIGGEVFSGKSPLAKKAALALKKMGGAPLSGDEIFKSASLLSRPGDAPEVLVRQALRLALLGIGLQDQCSGRDASPASLECTVGYGLLAGNDVIVALSGRVPQKTVQSLQKAMKGMKQPGLRLVSLGEWIPSGKEFLPMVCTSGEAEAVLSSGAVNLLLTGPGSDPALAETCRTLNITVAAAGGESGAGTLVQQARKDFDRRAASAFPFDAALVGTRKVSLDTAEAGKALLNKQGAKAALLGGSDTLFQCLGHLPVELAKALQAEGLAVSGWGDAALWMVKQDLPVGLLAPEEGPLTAIRALAAKGKLSALKGICFTGLKGCREFSFALGLAGLGLKVLVAVPLPLWGSKKVLTTLREELAAVRGILTHFDHPAKANVILDWFLRS